MNDLPTSRKPAAKPKHTIKVTMLEKDYERLKADADARHCGNVSAMVEEICLAGIRGDLQNPGAGA